MSRTASLSVLATLVVGMLAGVVHAADSYQVDPAHSSVVFKVRHFGISNIYGRFNAYSGQFSLDKADPSKNAFSFEIKAESIDTNQAKRDEHLRGPDFFNVKQFPTITFKSTAVTATGDDYSVKGDLTMHGVTKPVTLPLKKLGEMTDQQGKARVGFDATFTIKRSEFDMTYGVDKNMVGDEITLMVGFEGIKQ